MASPKSSTSKTGAKAAAASTKTRAMPAADIDRLVPLNNVKHVYLYHPNGTTRHLAVDSEAFVEAVREVAGLGFGERIRSQVDHMAATQPDSNWVTIKARLDAAAVYA